MEHPETKGLEILTMVIDANLFKDAFLKAQKENEALFKQSEEEAEKADDEEKPAEEAS